MTCVISDRITELVTCVSAEG